MYANQVSMRINKVAKFSPCLPNHRRKRADFVFWEDWIMPVLWVVAAVFMIGASLYTLWNL